MLVCFPMIDLKRIRDWAKVVVGAAILVMVAWIFDIAFLKSILPGQPSMKFNTALSFLFGGFLLYASAKPLASGADLKRAMVLITSLAILAIMIPSFITMIYGHSFDWENMLVEDQNPTPFDLIPGLPSIGTAIAFIILAFAGLTGLLNKSIAKTGFLLGGSVILFLAIVALAGYGLGATVLYYVIPGTSNGMAIHTAVLFVLLGKGFFDLGKEIPD